MITSAALALIAVATLSPARGAAPAVRGFCLVCGDVGGVDVVLNLILFLPLGAGLGLASWRGHRAFVLVLAVTATVELLQLSVIPGRDPSAGDVVMNAVGGMIGYWATLTGRQWLYPSRPLAWALAMSATAGWLGLQAATAHALAPSLFDRPWYGQVRRALAPYPEFEPQVGAVAVNGVALPAQRFEPAAALAALRTGAPVIQATLMAGPVPRGTASIYRITDDRRDEMLMLGRRGDALVFRLRTRAADLRLRRPTFVLPNAFGLNQEGDGSPAAESTRVIARPARDRLTLSSERGGVTQARTIRLSASWGWVLVMPFTLLLTSAVTTAGTALWLAGFLLPVGYWVRHGWSVEARPLVAVAAAVAVATLGLFAVPLAFGLRQAPAYEWATAVGAFAAGWLLADRLRQRLTTTPGDASA